MIHTIVNQHLASLTNCESEPIHIPGSIQPFGFLLGVRRGVLLIEYCSANTDAFIGVVPQDLLGKPLAELLSAEGVIQLQEYLFTEDASSGNPFIIGINGTVYNVHTRHRSELLLLEFEPKPVTELTLAQLYGQMKRFTHGAEQAASLKALSQMIAEETRAITGFDRVMIYRFDAEYNGEVIAESKREDLDPFLNLHYPHTDIPVQARQLYLQNLVRLIADVTYAPIPILTLNATADHRAVDLSHAVLRSVSPIHIEYLANMGVGASFSVSLVHEGRLWGLIACHHYSAKILHHHTRLAAQLQGHFLTSQIKVQEAKDAYDRTQAATAHLQQLKKILLNASDFIEEIHSSRHLIQMVNASGVLLVHDGVFYKNGIVPDDAALENLVGWLAAHTNTGHLHTHRLIDIYPKAKELGDGAAGIIYHSLGVSELNCMIWFRPEEAQTVEWAGNPEQAMLEKTNGVRISPRKSFAIWRQEVRNKSVEWSGAEISVAASFAYALQKQIHLTILARDEARYRRLSEQLTEANEELSRINWISTHDLKEPLRKIQMFGSRILESEKDQLSEMVTSSVSRMRVAAGRMQTLIDDILLYSKMSVKDGAAAPVALDDVIDGILAELEDDLAKMTIRRESLPVVKGINVQLSQLFRNLISNALKFAKKDTPLTLDIQCTVVPAPDLKEERKESVGQYYRVSIADNGIGFEEIYSSRIFDVFQRLHTTEDYPGTGIGLAISRKIMQNHEGAITAEGKTGEGATFHLYFPVDN